MRPKIPWKGAHVPTKVQRREIYQFYRKLGYSRETANKRKNNVNRAWGEYRKQNSFRKQKGIRSVGRPCRLNKKETTGFQKTFDKAGVSRRVSSNWLRNSDPSVVTLRDAQVRGFMRRATEETGKPWSVVKHEFKLTLEKNKNQTEIFEQMARDSASAVIGIRA